MIIGLRVETSRESSVHQKILEREPGVDLQSAPYLFHHIVRVQESVFEFW